MRAPLIAGMQAVGGPTQKRPETARTAWVASSRIRYDWRKHKGPRQIATANAAIMLLDAATRPCRCRLDKKKFDRSSAGVVWEPTSPETLHRI